MKSFLALACVLALVGTTASIDASAMSKKAAVKACKKEHKHDPKSSKKAAIKSCVQEKLGTAPAM